MWQKPNKIMFWGPKRNKYKSLRKKNETINSFMIKMKLTQSLRTKMSI